jgi:hypothetical protein
MGDFLRAGFVLLLLMASSSAGFLLQSRLRESHKRRETIDAVRLVMSILVTFTALVLGLLTSSVKSSYDGFESRFRAYASDLTSLDQRLREYGDGADSIRRKLRAYVAAAIADTWREEPKPSGEYPIFPHGSSLERQPLGVLLVDIDVDIRRLEPADPFHHQLAELLETRMTELLRQRWILVTSEQDTISWPLLAVMTAWLMIIFGVFGLSSPRNALVYVTILSCAISISSVVYLILDLDKPLDGLIAITSQPMRDTLAHIDAAS